MCHGLPRTKVARDRPSIADLYYFATTTDIAVSVYAALAYAAAGAAQAQLSMILSHSLAAEPGDSLADAGRQIFFTLSMGVGIPFIVLHSSASIAALYVRHHMMARWKVGYLRATLRQDIGWYDVNSPQELASRMGESMLLIDKALSVPTFQGLFVLGTCFGAIVTAFTNNARLAGALFGVIMCTVVPGSILLATTLGTRTSRLADAYADAGGYCTEVLGSVKTVAALGLERMALRRYDDKLAVAMR